MNQHVICREVFKVDFFSQEKGFAFQQEFIALIKTRIQNILDQVLTELSVPKTIIRLDKVEIDLGEFSYPLDEIELEIKLRSKLSEVINFKIVSISHSVHKEAELVTYARSEFELIEYFLTTGYLPWWSNVVVEREKKPFNEIVLQHIKKSPAAFEKLFKKDKAVLTRFIHQFGISPVVTLLTRKDPSLVAALQDVYRQVSVNQLFNQVQGIEKHFWAFGAEYVLKKNISDKKIIEEKFIIYLQEKNLVSVEHMISSFPEVYIREWINKNLPGYRVAIFEIIKILTEVFKEKKVDMHVVQNDLFSILLKIIAENRNKAITKAWLLNKTIPKVSEKFHLAVDELLEALYKKTENARADYPFDKKTENTGNNPFDKKTENTGSNSFDKQAGNATSTGADKPTNNAFDKKDKISESAAREHSVIVTNYLVYGYISWADRAIGVEGIEILIWQLHDKKPEQLKTIFKKINSTQLPYVIIRIENQFSPALSKLVFDRYIDKRIFLEIIESRKFEAEIIKAFFVNGVVPWMERLNYSVRETENILIRFYNRDPAYFIRIVNELNIAAKPEIINRIKEQFSDEFILFLKNEIESLKVILSSESAATIQIELSDVLSNPDLIIYYLLYYFDHRRLDININFRIEDLIEKFIEKYQKESKLFFSALSQNRVMELPEDLKNKVLELINESNKIKTEERRLDVKENISDAIYIKNSGLILIHPFLQRFFSLLSLLDKRKFKDEYSQHKAVYLLQYIVDKSEDAEEHMLVLNKIICGMKLHEPIQKGILLTEEEKETCESLLQGVIQNWSILKNTSNDGLRTSFLQRDGRLIYEEAGWRLKVEERGFDILIDRIPWTIGMFKLPWMDKSMTVEWR